MPFRPDRAYAHAARSGANGFCKSRPARDDAPAGPSPSRRCSSPTFGATGLDVGLGGRGAPSGATKWSAGVRIRVWSNWVGTRLTSARRDYLSRRVEEPHLLTADVRVGDPHFSEIVWRSTGLGAPRSVPPAATRGSRTGCVRTRRGRYSGSLRELSAGDSLSAARRGWLQDTREYSAAG